MRNAKHEILKRPDGSICHTVFYNPSEEKSKSEAVLILTVIVDRTSAIKDGDSCLLMLTINPSKFNL